MTDNKITYNKDKLKINKSLLLNILVKLLLGKTKLYSKSENNFTH